MTGTTIAHYRILEKLGEGGMGVVYKAEDTKLKRTVALKFLPAELTSDPQANKRFLQEAQAAAALDHANICTIYEISEVEGRMFIVMAYVKGRSLKDKIALGPMKLEEAVDIATQVAAGLRAAHEKGIIHRDIKPANIMLAEDGPAKIMDFGIAKLAWAADLTRTAGTMGTLAYMSPEQARGEAVDQRTDIWSLGAVLYEMLAGRLPFPAEAAPGMIFSILNKDPEPLGMLRPDVPRHIEQVIAKALAKDPAFRYKNIQEFAVDLKAPSPDFRPKAEKSIIVLPFEDISPGKDNEYFSDGLTEEIITDLSHVHDLLVISRSSAMTFKGTKKKIPEIAREVNVRYALEGSVRKAGNSLRITAQLIDGANDAHLWAEKYSGSLDDVFDIQEKVSRSILEALKLKLTLREGRVIAEKPIENSAAYECYLRAKHEIMQFTGDGLERAFKDLQNGLDIIGDNAALFAGLGFVHVQMVNMGIGQQEHLDEARRYVEKAFSLDKESAQAHLVLGISLILEANAKEAVKHLKWALARDPGDADSAAWLAWAYLLNGKIAAGSSVVEKYRQRDPISPGWHVLAGLIDFMAGRFELAAEGLGRSYRIFSDMPMQQFWYALCLAYAGRLQESISVLAASASAAPTEDGWVNLGKLLNFTLLRDLKNITNLFTPSILGTFKRDCQFSYHLGCFYAYLGERDLALDWLENAVNRGMFNYPLFAEYDPFLEEIRGEERFRNLMERVKYEWEHFEE
jgi:eukaryotic-like serine/threonine-protein kinase